MDIAINVQSLFRQLFGYYVPVENVASIITDGNTTTTTYTYVTDWSTVFNYIMVVILFYTVCKVVGSIIINMCRSVTLR